MFRQSIRRFGTTALRAAGEGSTAYATRVSTAQGVVNGLTEGMSSSDKASITNYANPHHSYWKHSAYPAEEDL